MAQRVIIAMALMTGPRHRDLATIRATGDRIVAPCLGAVVEEAPAEVRFRAQAHPSVQALLPVREQFLAGAHIALERARASTTRPRKGKALAFDPGLVPGSSKLADVVPRHDAPFAQQCHRAVSPRRVDDAVREGAPVARRIRALEGKDGAMTPEGMAGRDRIRAVRGRTLPLHASLAERDPAMPRRQGDLAAGPVFGDARSTSRPGSSCGWARPRRSGATARGEWAAVGAIRNGAARKEVCKAFDEMTTGKDRLDLELPEETASRRAGRRRPRRRLPRPRGGVSGSSGLVGARLPGGGMRRGGCPGRRRMRLAEEGGLLPPAPCGSSPRGYLRKDEGLGLGCGKDGR